MAVPAWRERGRDNFKQLVVKDCICPTNVLTRVRVEKFASRARAYICTSHHLEQMSLQNKAADAITVNENSTSDAAPAGALKQELLYSEIERLMKAFKGHRCALDFDRGFVNSELKEATGKKDDNTT